MGVATLFLAGAGTGLLAGGTTCAAVQLGLLTGAVSGGRKAPEREASGPRSVGGEVRARLVRPVAAFLAAKLVSHALLGAVLGLAGGAFQPGPRVRGAMLAAAALMLAVFALDLLGFRPARRLLRRRGAERWRRGAERWRRGAERCRPPRSGRPAVLGAATVLLPCGLTLSAELLAVSSGSALGGAAVMAGFVLGTAPLFGLVGVTVGRSLAAVRGRLAALLAVGLLAVAGWTLAAGLRLGGWLPDGGGTAPASGASRFVSTDASGTQLVTVWALDRGYRPSLLGARAGVRTVLVVKTAGTRGHTRAFTIPSLGRDVILPVTGETRIDLGAPGPGRMRFVCASGHFPGAITFR
ncbi:sulfite exporter TauE/SafE family protein [Actinomadura madurae]|uniref:urease accessory protein UreH domain-containing protein n=1 Tax=Actinomadura madurae TaxID=1993 RepID=UPI002026DFA2|nr:sulfite exporter TauE/SafE family protein [Actinomadura madurae]URN01342.1 sulfite exporter TauE/SafE family protein [Actinomadura madurae]